MCFATASSTMRMRAPVRSTGPAPAAAASEVRGRGASGTVSGRATRAAGPASSRARTPWGRNSKVVWPFSSRPVTWLSRVEPKPVCSGAETTGPPDSTQSRAKPPLGVTAQVTSTRPVSADRAPYFRALVASSCRASDRALAARGVRKSSGPSQRVWPGATPPSSAAAR